MRTPHDQRQKVTLRDLLSPAGTVETEHEVSSDSQRVDLWFVPNPGATEALDGLGALGRIARVPCAFEPFSRAPSVNDALECVRKHLTLRHALALREGHAEDSERAPMLWILAAGTPDRAIEELGFVADREVPGVFRLAPAMRVGLVALAELAPTRDTLLLRLLGRGATLARAIRELIALPSTSPERSTMQPILLRWRLHVTLTQNAEEQDFVMETVDLYLELERELQLKGRQIGITEGRAQGRAEGVRDGELRVACALFARRLGRPLDERETAQLADKLATLGEDRVAAVVLDSTVDELARWLIDPSAT
jgi:hypothetical protein